MRKRLDGELKKELGKALGNLFGKKDDYLRIPKSTAAEWPRKGSVTRS